MMIKRCVRAVWVSSDARFGCLYFDFCFDRAELSRQGLEKSKKPKGSSLDALRQVRGMKSLTKHE